MRILHTMMMRPLLPRTWSNLPVSSRALLRSDVRTSHCSSRICPRAASWLARRLLLKKDSTDSRLDCFMQSSLMMFPNGIFASCYCLVGCLLTLWTNLGCRICSKKGLVINPLQESIGIFVRPSVAVIFKYVTHYDEGADVWSILILFAFFQALERGVEDKSEQKKIKYWRDLNQALASNWTLLFTGRTTVSSTITVDFVKSLSTFWKKRKLIILDNFPGNYQINFGTKLHYAKIVASCSQRLPTAHPFSSRIRRPRIRNWELYWGHISQPDGQTRSINNSSNHSFRLPSRTWYCWSWCLLRAESFLITSSS